MSKSLSDLGQFGPIKRVRDIWNASVLHIGLVMTILIIVDYAGDIVTNWNGGKMEFEFQTQRTPGGLEWLMIIIFTTLFAFVEKFIIFLITKFLLLLRKGPRGKSVGAAIEFYGILVGIVFLGFVSVYMFALDIYWTRLALRSIFSDHLSLVLSFGVNAFQFVGIALVGYNTKPAEADSKTPAEKMWIFNPKWNVLKVAAIIAVGLGVVYYVAVMMPTQSNAAVVVNNGADSYVPLDQTLGVNEPQTPSTNTSTGSLAPTPIPPALRLDNGSTCTRVHVVAQGETLFRIAQANGWNVNDLAARNGITNPNLINVGQQICVQ